LALTQSSSGDGPSLEAFDTDRINELLTVLGQLDEAVGQPVPKRLLPQGMVGIEVSRERLVEAARVLRDSLSFDMLTCVSGVDMVDHIESVYHFRSLSRNWLLQARVKLPNDEPAVDSLVGLYPSANWLERECYDMLGITYRGHPDLRRILLDDDFNGYPLLKTFHPTPLTVHDRATTQADAVRAVAGEQQRNVERIVSKNLGQGDEERVHPGKQTFGSAAVYVKTGQGVEAPDVPAASQAIDAPKSDSPSGPQRG
jgi:NADH/F420H2 dehydrogenase subunit C